MKHNVFTYIKIKAIRLWFKYQLQKEELIKVDDRTRGIGKTTMMVDLASKKGYGIVVGFQSTADHIRSLDKDIKIYRLADNFTLEVAGKEDNVLIDESVKPEMVERLKAEFPQMKIRGGFIQNYGNEVK